MFVVVRNVLIFVIFVMLGIVLLSAVFDIYHHFQMFLIVGIVLLIVLCSAIFIMFMFSICFAYALCHYACGCSTFRDFLLFLSYVFSIVLNLRYVFCYVCLCLLMLADYCLFVLDFVFFLNCVMFA